MEAYQECHLRDTYNTKLQNEPKPATQGRVVPLSPRDAAMANYKTNPSQPPRLGGPALPPRPCNGKLQNEPKPAYPKAGWSRSPPETLQWQITKRTQTTRPRRLIGPPHLQEACNAELQNEPKLATR